jgi:FixJ family two-component response regulator
MRIKQNLDAAPNVSATVKRSGCPHEHGYPGVDDEADIRDLVAGILEDEGHGTRKAGSSDEALAAVHARRPHLVFLDIWLQGSRLDGLQVLDLIKAEHPDLPIVMISGHGNIETAVSAIKAGAYDFIEKPFKADRLVLVAERALEAWRLKREVKDLRSRSTQASRIAGRSVVMNQLRQAIDKVAPTNARILIAGSPGSGKELVARAIHGSLHAPQAPLSPSTPRRSRRTTWKPSSSAWRRTRRAGAGRAPSRRLMAGRCISTRSPTCLVRCRGACSGSWSSRISSVSAAQPGFMWMCASSRPRAGIFRPRSSVAHFGRTSFTASASFRSACPRSPSGARTSGAHRVLPGPDRLDDRPAEAQDRRGGNGRSAIP